MESPIGKPNKRYKIIEIPEKPVIGNFAINAKLYNARATRKLPTTSVSTKDKSLFADDKPLYGYKNILEGLIKENGYFKDAQKAEVAVKRAVYTQVKDSLCKKSAFAEGDEGARAFRRFLATANVK